MQEHHAYQSDIRNVSNHQPMPTSEFSLPQNIRSAPCLTRSATMICVICCFCTFSLANGMQLYRSSARAFEVPSL
jgi:hypothetical protein